MARKTERLEKMKLPEEQMRKMSAFFTSYRTQEEEDELTLEGAPAEEYEENNLYNEDDDKDGKGTVTFTVYE